jgi:holo-[acyl-carrier protein] synthase
MIVGIGTDIVAIARIEAVLQRQGNRFAERILHPDELLEFLAHAQPARFLSKRFAVKEAASKAVGTGIGQGVSWRDVKVEHTELGAPILCMSGEAAVHAQQKSVTQQHVSLADEQDSVVAFVVLSN